ncbi:MAG: hypothetical protein FJ265_17195 [Planctomycetes bacterium]|nr:hypothetical protein [Planctomycetota bacterium]
MTGLAAPASTIARWIVLPAANAVVPDAMLNDSTSDWKRVEPLRLAGSAPEPDATPLTVKFVASPNTICTAPAAMPGPTSTTDTEEPEGLVLAEAASVPEASAPERLPVTVNAVAEVKPTVSTSCTAVPPSRTLPMVPLLVVLVATKRPAKSNGLTVAEPGDVGGRISCWFCVGPKKNAEHESIAATPRSCPWSSFSVNVSVTGSPIWCWPIAPVPPPTAVIADTTPASIAGSFSGCTCASTTEIGS